MTFDRQSSGRGRAGMKSHTFMLWKFFVYMYLGNKYADFQEKLFIVVSNVTDIEGKYKNGNIVKPWLV